MKKFLFTLATVLAFSLIAEAQNKPAPVLAFGTDANTLITEIELAPGQTSGEIHVVLVEMEETVVQGLQIQWLMKDVNGELTESVICPKVYGGRTKFWAQGENISTANEAVGGMAGNSLACANPFFATWRWVGTNTSSNQFWFNTDNDGNPICPICVGVFKIQVPEDWAEEYVTFELDRDYTLYNQTPSDEPGDQVNNYEVQPTNPMILKIKNANYTAPEDQDLTGEIVFGDLDENGTFTVSYNGPEEVTLTITVNGEEVELVDGAYTLPAYGSYEVTVTATADGYKPESRMKIFTWEEPVVEQTAAPEVNFEMRGEQLWCVVTGEGNIFVDGQDYGPAPVEFLVTTQTTEEQEGSFFVYALADGKTQSETVRAAWTCEAKEVPVEYAETPVITYDAETLTVTATSADEVHLFINGIPVEGNSYTFEQTAEEVTYQVTAYASAENKENSPYASLEVVVPAKEVEYTAVPVVTVEITDDAYIFTATGDGEVTLYVDGVEVENPYTVARPETEPEEPYAVYVYATAQEDGKEMSQSDVQRIVIEPKPAVTPQPTPEPEVTIDVTDDAIVINVDGGDAEIHVYVDGVEITEPYTIERGDADKDVTITVTAQGDGMEMTTVEIPYTIPAKEVEPVDPGDHTVGKWVVFIDKDGNEQWYKLTEHEASEPADQDQAETSVALTYEIFGAFDYYGGAERPNVDFFFVVDGVRYGATENETVPVWGQANDNPLVEGENYWCAPVGYKYTVGIVTNVETGEMFMQISQGIFVGVDEMNADKAIAGVRYFNMAGQEMQQANGMTIVVTTYTDGTTTAVKVMK